MGKCENATASIGIKILLSDLVLQINETNYTLIKEMLHNGYIEDENSYFNEVYLDIIINDELPNYFLNLKKYLISNFT